MIAQYYFPKQHDQIHSLKFDHEDPTVLIKRNLRLWNSRYGINSIVIYSFQSMIWLYGRSSRVILLIEIGGYISICSWKIAIDWGIPRDNCEVSGNIAFGWFQGIAINGFPVGKTCG